MNAPDSLRDTAPNAVMRPTMPASPDTIPAWVPAATPTHRIHVAAATTKTIESVNGLILVDDRTVASIDGRPVALRQFTAVSGTRGLALAFRFVDVADMNAAFAEAAAIAATWRMPVAR